MPSTTVTLGKLTDLAIEQQAWGGLGWTANFLTTNAATTVAVTAVATPPGPVTHFLDYMTLSWNSATTAAGSLTIFDGTTVIYTVQIPISCTNPLHFDFSRRPLRSQPGLALEIRAPASGAAVQMVQAAGHSSRDIGTY